MMLRYASRLPYYRNGASIQQRLFDQASIGNLNQRPYCSTKYNHNRESSKQNEAVRPYSDSVPPVGYEWCKKCGIRLPRFQKRIGEPDPCYDELPPRIIWFLPPKICHEARQYYQLQGYVVVGLATGIFLVPSMIPSPYF
jgi:hypothetical protein